MSFETYDRALDLHWNRRAQVSIRKGGTIALNYVAYNTLNSPEFVQLLFDRTQKAIGIKPCAEEDPNAFKVYSPQRNGRPDRSASVHARGFLRHYKVPFELGVRRYNARYENGMVVVHAKEQS